MQNNKVLFVTISEKGHINPMIGIAQHLQASGCELAFFAQKDISGQLKNAGLNSRVYTGSAMEDSEFVTSGKIFVKKLSDKVWLHNWIKTLLIDVVPSQIQNLHASVNDFNPSLIVMDPMVYAAAIVAHQRNIPWVGVSSSLNPITPSSWQSDLTDTLDALNDHRVSLFEQYGLKPHFKISDAISPWLNIVFSTEEYMPRAVCENDFSFYVGDCLPLYNRGDETSFPFERLQSGKKIVYMSLGSQLYYHPQLFDCVSQALYETDIQLIFSLNELIHTPFANQLPANVIPVKYAPQIELLRHVDLMITHGGANSVMESLTQGIPVALLPICNDQFLQARFVKNANAGIVLDAFQPDPDVYRKQLLPLLEEDSAIRRSITKIRESFKRYGGAREAASLIMQLLNTKKPLMPV